MSKSVAQKSRLLGSFAPPGRTAVFGELRLKGGKTNLRLRDDKPINVERQVPVIHGWLHDLYKASCIDCVVGGPGRSSREGEGSFHFRDVFPHFVAIGNAFLLPDQPSIAAVYFTVDDATSLFYDFDAFGLV